MRRRSRRARSLTVRYLFSNRRGQFPTLERVSKRCHESQRCQIIFSVQVTARRLCVSPEVRYTLDMQVTAPTLRSRDH